MSYSNGLLSDQSYQTANKYVQRGLPGVGFKLTDMGDYDMQNKKLVNVDEGENNQDVVNKHQLDVGLQTKPNKTDVLLLDGTSHMVGDLDLRGNKIILPGEIQMDRKLITNLDTDENQDLSAVNMITLKNKVEPKADKDYVDFEITKQNALINNTFVKKTGDQMNGDLILPHDSYPVDGNTNKAISYETQREIFLSRRESFPMQADINMNNNLIQNIATPTSSHQGVNKGYCDYNFLNRQKGGVIMGPLSMNQNDLTGIPDTPKFGYSAVNKNYVDGEITKIDTTPFVKLDSSRTMTGNLDMGGKKITGIGNPTSSFHSTDAVNFRSMVGTLRGFRLGLNRSFVHLDGSEAMTGNLDMGDHSIQKVGEPVNSDDVATKNYVDGEIGYISTPFLKLDGTRAMTGILNMNDHKISNLKMPELNTDAANKQYIDEALLKSHLVSSHIENAFKYLLDQDESSSEKNIIVNGIQDFNGSPHKNKKAYSIDSVYTPGTQNYDSKIGINLYSLPIGKYTIIMEYYFPENINISLVAESSTAVINKQVTTSFSNHKKQLVQFDQRSKDTPDYLFFNIRGGATTSTNPEGYLVFYGVKEWVDSVPPEIYDHALETGMFEYDGGKMKMNMDLDLTSHNIINSYQITRLTDFMNYFLPFKNFMKNKTYIDIFTYRFYDLKEPSNFILDGPAISGIYPNMSIISSGSSHITVSGFDPIRGLQFNPSTKIIIDFGYMVNQNSPYTIMISLTLKDHLRLYFVEPTHEQTAYSPAYIYNPVDHTIRIEITKTMHVQNYPVVLDNKQAMIWIYYNPSETKYEIIIGNGNYRNLISPPISKINILLPLRHSQK